jgi:hypothetical protein
VPAPVDFSLCPQCQHGQLIPAPALSSEKKNHPQFFFSRLFAVGSAGEPFVKWRPAEQSELRDEYWVPVPFSVSETGFVYY